MKVTLYKDIYSMDDPYYKTVDEALARIQNGRSRQKIEEIRSAYDNAKADALKKSLPAVCFSGEFGKTREDKDMKSHSGFLVLDFDYVGKEELGDLINEMINYDFVYAAWVSPRGNGLKVLVKIADGKKHREHFEALKEMFPKVDKSGINESRVCFESYDPNLYINKDAIPFTKIKTIEYVQTQEVVREELEIFKRLLTWLTNRNDAFVSGERNNFIFKLAAACCRFGLGEGSVTDMILAEHPTSNDFTQKEACRTIRSAYRANQKHAGSATFVNDKLVEKTSRKEVVIDAAAFDASEKLKDVIYGEDVKEQAVEIFKKGYKSVKGIGVKDLDYHYKAKPTELTLLGGYGNYGKSTWMKWFLLMRVLLFGEKFALFSPEENPAEEFYHDFVEMILGCDCTPSNQFRPSIEEYNAAYDWVSKHIFYVYPKDVSPTPEYVKERFLELIIKEKVSGIVIDPFNQLTNDYSRTGGNASKYLELIHSDFKRFAILNNVYLWIVAHPRQPKEKDSTGNYPAPDVFEMADGAMWNNKMDNILIYHRPEKQTRPEDRTCVLYSKKIRKQKTVGKPGDLTFMYNTDTRRYLYNGIDPLKELLKDNPFKPKQGVLL